MGIFSYAYEEASSSSFFISNLTNDLLIIFLLYLKFLVNRGKKTMSSMLKNKTNYSNKHNDL